MSGEGEREREGGRECMEIHSRKGGGSCESVRERERVCERLGGWEETHINSDL